jgi:glycosyltransferase involved in cell wall biosynthesis
MRLVISAGIFPPDVGGPASYVPAIAAALCARGHQVAVVCLSDNPAHTAAFPFPLVRVARKGSKAHRFATVVRELRRQGADVVYANGLSLEAQTAGELGGAPVVHKVVGDWAWERARNRNWYRGGIDEYQSARKGPRLRLLDWLRTTPLRRAAGVIAPSQYLKDTIASWGIQPQKIRVVYNSLPPVAAALPTLELPSFSGSTLMTVCRLVPWKGIEGLLEVIRDRRDWRLVVVGDGPLRPTLESRAASLGVEDRVSWMGWRTHDEVQALLAKADVFVLNSTYEGLPHVVLEAMRAGVPVVATSVGGTPEVVSHDRTGLLVSCGDQTALRRAVTEILSSPAKARELVGNARAWTHERFEFETMVAKTEQVLAAAVDSGRTVHAR